MELVNKETNYKIKVNSRKNRIIVTKGFVTITSGSHYAADKVRSDIIEKDYHVPKNAYFG
jgi:hypothetical protein